jgi:hypothetical protein
MSSKIHNAQIPFNILPEEIIAEIFLYSVVDPYAHLEKPWKGTYGRLHAILAVCSLWNEIALQTPRCVSSVNFIL